MATTGADRITLEIIQSSLQAISDEMFAAFRKTAMSAIIYEVLDMGTAITDGEGNLGSSGAGIPAPVSRTEITARASRRRIATSIVSESRVWFTAFSIRASSATLSRSASEPWIAMST